MMCHQPEMTKQRTVGHPNAQKLSLKLHSCLGYLTGRIGKLWPRQWLILSVITLFSPTLSATVSLDKTPLTLTQAVNLALSHAPEWQSFQKQISAQQESVNQARSGLLPNLVLSAQTAKTEIETNGVKSEGNSNQASLTLTQPLLNLDAWFTYQASRNTSQQLDYQLNASYQQFIVDVSNTFLNVLREQSQLTFANAELNATRQQLEQAQQRFEVGLIAITDVHEAQAANDLAEVNRIASETNLDIALENLGRLTGTKVAGVSQIKTELPIVNPSPNNMSNWVEKAQRNNPNILAAKAAKKGAKQVLRSTSARFSPTINLFLNRSEGNGFADSMDSDTSQIGVELSYPLFQGLRNVSARKQASLEHLASADDLQAAIKNTLQTTRNVFRSVQTDVLRVRAHLQAIKSSSSALEATEAGYEVGTRNVVDVLNAQRSLFAAKRDHSIAKYSYLINSLQLQEAAGEINGETIKALDKWLEE